MSDYIIPAGYGEAEHILREAQKQAETLFLEGQDAP